MIEIKATGDTTLHTAGKYCEEDILVKVPSAKEPLLQDKTITPTTSAQTVEADNNYDGLNIVTVNAIPSEYENVATETNAYTNELSDLLTKISALETALEGKAAGGSSGSTSVETCTVKFSTSYGAFTTYAYSTLENGLMKSVVVYGNTPTEVIVENVVCNSLFTIDCTKNVSVETAIGANNLYQLHYWHITASAGETVTVKLYNPF